MSNQVHPSSVIESGVELDGVKIGPFCHVRAGVRIGKGTELVSHVSIEGDTVLGQDNVVFSFASIGAQPQDLKFRGESSRTRIGDRNHFRESVTVHRGTEAGCLETSIGSDCLFMAYSHVAHDCAVGNRVVLANCASLGGHVVVEDFAILGGLSGVHQFCKVGTRAFLSAGTMIGMDAPPFVVADGRRAGLAGINVTGLRRAGFTDEDVKAVQRAYKEFYKAGRTRDEALAALAAETNPHVQTFAGFIRASARGVLRPRREKQQSTD